MQKTVSELASVIQGKVIGDEKSVITGITNMELPGPGLITFIQDPKHLKKAEESSVACLIVPPSITQSTKILIQTKDPKLAWAKLLRVFHPEKPFSKTISPLSAISKSAKIGKNVTIEAFVTIHDNASIADDVVLRSHSSIGENVTLGAKTIIHSNVVIYENCIIGSEVVIHAGSVIGADGFGYVHTADGQQKVPQVGNVVIGDQVELGASVTIDRATVGSTTLGQGCKIDNLVQIGHNVVIGPHTVISAQSGISGSCKIGSHVTMGGKAGLGDHVEIGDWTMVGAGAGFPSGKKVPAKQIYFGEPARPYQEARKQIAAQLRSAETLDEVRKLRAQVAELEKQLAKLPSSK